MLLLEILELHRSPELAQKKYGIGTTVYAERNDKILLLKRAMGAAQGSWYLPGGGLDDGETPEQCALRELREETGLKPTGNLRLIAVTPMFVYESDVFLVEFACVCDTGEVTLSDEHSDHRWILPEDWRSNHLSDYHISTVAKKSRKLGEMSKSIRAGLDKYLLSKSEST